MERKRDAACIMVTLGESTLRHLATCNSFSTNEIAARGSGYLALVEQAHTGLAAYHRRIAICCVFITPCFFIALLHAKPQICRECPTQ
jgi:hypothetical protein